MKTKSSVCKYTIANRFRSLVSASLVLQTSLTFAAATDISQLPLVSSSSVAVKPNLFYLLDTSGSMARMYIADALSSNMTKNCGKNNSYNGLYYNPNFTYTPPVTAAGASFSNASFTAAYIDGYDTSSDTVNLSNGFRPWISGTDGPNNSPDSPEAAYYYKYTGSNPSTPVTQTCYSNASYTKVVVSATSGPGNTDERRNFANWYSYYRTRMLLTKTAMGQAFNVVDDRYRVGFATIYNSSWGSSNSGYLIVNTFDATQKASFYSKIYAQDPGGSTPLRGALNNIGKLFQKTLNGAPDPIQYSCQRNFTILATDGFWNDSFSGIGNQDSSAARPFYDGGYSGAQNTLADIAYYYWKTDLRSSGSIGALGADVSNDNVHPTATDPATWQHMNLFTIGLGANGILRYQNNYDVATSGDYYNIATGALTGCNGFTSDNKCNWPVPSGDQPSTIDDLWHSAVNGHGKYFSAQSPSSLRNGLQQILNALNSTLGANAAAATSNPNIVAGDNYLFSTNFTTVNWFGDVFRQTIDVNTGAISGTNWSAQALLDTKTSASTDSRTIHMFSSVATSRLVPFNWGNLSSTQQGYFSATSLSQYGNYNSAQLANVTCASCGQNLVNYIRGQRGYEIDPNNTTAATSLFNQRTHILGDIVSSEAAYVKAPHFSYTDTGYAAFQNANTSRQGAVYVGANDGMLHAFNADNGQELWAYVPSFVMPNLVKLADANYGASHQYFVDGTPVVGDISVSGTWKTILVGGLNAGGRGYYAIDVTDPLSPKGLWEFSDNDLGLTFSNPIITKNQAGQWVVLIASGYNNTSPGSGQGFLYVLNANTGALIQKIGTGVGSTTNPSGLVKISAWVDNGAYDNTMLRVYGGDLYGNVWRFDPDVQIPGDVSKVVLLATLKDAAGNAQPITVQPELGDVGTSSSVPVVYVGTGKYLGTSDLATTSQQSFYAIKDLLSLTGYGNPRTTAGFIQQTLTGYISQAGAKERTTTTNSVNLIGSDKGWYVDLPDSGERSVTAPSLDLGILTFTTNVPNSDACTAGGYSWINFLDFRTGSFLSTSAGGKASVFLGNELSTRPVIIRLPNGKILSITRGSLGDTTATPVPPPPSVGSGKRISWRDIIQQ